MKFFLQMGLLSGLMYAASGCCCANYCCEDSNYGCAPITTSCQQNYSTVNTGGFQTTAQTNGTMNYQNVANPQMAQTPQYSSPAGNLCPCEMNGFSGTTMQGINGMPIEGMVYDASVVPTPVNASTPAKANVVPKRQPVPQPQFETPVGLNGQPLVPPAPPAE